ncbi:MAG: hypothetical protein EBU90_17145, partial [Proteobacteria bacterium]|nr:hypothetical protein [Pseudomonadota bacterium]
MQSTEFNFDGLDGFADDVAGIAHQRAPLTPDDSLSLIKQFSIHRYLNDPFYRFTTPIKSRSYFDLECLQFQNNSHNNYIFSPFFTQTSRAVLGSNDKKHLKDYLSAISFLDSIDNNMFTGFDLPLALSVFKNIKVQDRQLGIMFQKSATVQNWNLSFLWPFLYQERNFFLNKQEIKTLEKLGLNTDDFSFAQDHLISDKIGFGDLRIQIEKNILSSYRNQLNIGFGITLPLAFSMIKGCIGSHFNKNKSNPIFHLQKDFLGYFDPGVQNPNDPNNLIIAANAKTLGLQALDRFSALLLEAPLGNDRHLGLLTFLKHIFYIRSDVFVSSKINFELLLPSVENRFFNTRPDKTYLAEFEAMSQDDVDALDEAGAAPFIDSFSSILMNSIFPSSYHTRVFPGVSIQSTNQLTFERINWNFHLGTDNWYRSKEKIGKIWASDELLSQLDIKAGTIGHAYQSRVFTKIERVHQEGAFFDWNVFASTSLLSYGIGDSFS